MYLASGWNAYEILDAGNGDKLERWGDVTLLRPDPQAIWTMRDAAARADAVYYRSASGGGHWEYKKQLPEQWTIAYRDLRFIVRPTGFKHTGLFPEQAVNWDWMRERIEAHGKRTGRRAKVLNLFAYTGGATCACAKAGAEVVHVDAAKGMVAWAKDNAAASGLETAPIRYLVDDCVKFVRREIRRGNRYDVRRSLFLSHQFLHDRPCADRAFQCVEACPAGRTHRGGRDRAADPPRQSGAAVRRERKMDAA